MLKLEMKIFLTIRWLLSFHTGKQKHNSFKTDFESCMERNVCHNNSDLWAVLWYMEKIRSFNLSV